jgi:hypothetical protein
VKFPQVFFCYLKKGIFKSDSICSELKTYRMRGVNRVMLIGNLGKDPDVQHLEGNIAVAKFPLATTETYKDRCFMARISRTGTEIPSQRQPDLC